MWCARQHCGVTAAEGASCRGEGCACRRKGLTQCPPHPCHLRSKHTAASSCVVDATHTDKPTRGLKADLNNTYRAKVVCRTGLAGTVNPGQNAANRQGRNRVRRHCNQTEAEDTAYTVTEVSFAGVKTHLPQGLSATPLHPNFTSPRHSPVLRRYSARRRSYAPLPQQHHLAVTQRAE